jgi:hypothetical protein
MTEGLLRNDGGADFYVIYITKPETCLPGCEAGHAAPLQGTAIAKL